MEPLLTLKQEKLSIEVTTRCNINCSHCFARARTSRCSSLSKELVKEIISEGYSAGYRRLHITGGEPLLWESLFDVLDHAFCTGYRTVFLNTNGTLMTKHPARRLSDYDGLWMSVSLDGRKALHEYFRGAGTYGAAVQGIENALNAGIRLFVYTIGCKSMLLCLPYFVRDVYHRFPDIKAVTIIPLFRPGEDHFALSHELVGTDGFLELVRAVFLLNMGGYPIDFLNEPLVNAVSKKMNMPWQLESSPLYREGSIIVMANRDIRLSHSGQHSFLQYKPGAIEKVLTSEKYKEAVKPDSSICPSCKYLELCRKSGMYRPSESYDGVMNRYKPYCRQVLNEIAELDGKGPWNKHEKRSCFAN